MKSFLLYWAIKIYRLLIKIEIKQEFNIEAYSSPIIFVFWHETILFLSFAAPKNREIAILISTHKDGQLASDTIKHFGLKNIGGSSNRNPMKAFLEMLKWIKSGKDIGITPDGPKGPRRTMKKGAIELAYLSKCPIVAISCDASNAWRVNSWDRMIIPKPFSTITFHICKPISILNKKEFKEKSNLIERQLNES